MAKKLGTQKINSSKYVHSTAVGGHTKNTEIQAHRKKYVGQKLRKTLARGGVRKIKSSGSSSNEIMGQKINGTTLGFPPFSFFLLQKNDR